MRGHTYALQCDVRKYFPSIDHAMLKTIYRRLIKDRSVLWLMDLIVDSSNVQEPAIHWFEGDDLFAPLDRRRGLPIGNLTSQWFANWYLNGLDHFVTSRLRIGAYVRYCDDFIVLDDDRAKLLGALGAVKAELATIRLRLHEERADVTPTRAGLQFVGYRVWATYRLLRKANVRAMRRRVRWLKSAYAAGLIYHDDVRARLVSWIGHARQASSARLLQRMSKAWRFAGPRAP